MDFIAIIHTLSATLSIFIGGWVLFKPKGTSLHKKMGGWYFYLMILNNATALLIYKATGKAFFPHYLAGITLFVLLIGYYSSIIKYKGWLLVHLFCFILSYYFLIGGAVNEFFLRTFPDLRPMIIHRTKEYTSTQMIVSLLFIGLIGYYLIKYKTKKKS